MRKTVVARVPEPSAAVPPGTEAGAPVRASGIGPVQDDPASESLTERVYRELRLRLVTGRIAPGATLSSRGLAQELDVSPMPVREAVGRLVAESALEVHSKRYICVPAMTRARFQDLLHCRLLLEPEAARLALPFIEPAHLRLLVEADERLSASLVGGDAQKYMQSNFDFHFLIYGARAQLTMLHLIETLWLQFGPWMRVVYGRVGTAHLLDRHKQALQAIREADAEALAKAIHDDIAEGMGLIGLTGLDP
ncbi:MAG: GntR family transcriptional regulator [Pseudomonadota bacterium]|nr:GntR family transcriptional regulator [Pseudomonadota bacterium]